jgi:cell wall-associated NlpC family hydrolase
VSDPRLTLLRDGLAAEALDGLVAADRYGPVQPYHCKVSAAAIRSAADDASDQQDQLIFGEMFDVLAETAGFCLGQARRDGYVGYVARAALEPGVTQPTHWVSALRTYAYSKADQRSAAVLGLSLNSPVRVTGAEGRFAAVEGAGFVFEGHLSPIGVHRRDLAGVAEQFLAAPYQWGGRESLGLDCSGLVQQALYAVGAAGPRDSDMQAGALGCDIDKADLARGDLVFWEGHVGVMLDARRMIHANAHHMAVAIEPVAEAIDRISAAGLGEPTRYCRPL